MPKGKPSAQTIATEKYTKKVGIVAKTYKLKKELVDGISTVIFPEGTRTKTGEMGRFKQGAFKIAMDLNLPVVPLSLTGFYDAMPSGQAFVNPRARVRLHIGEPIDISQFADINEAMAHLRTKVESGIHNA